MKKFIINSCIKYIKKNTNYNSTKLAEIKYGLESIYLTFSKLFFIAILSIILNLFKEVISFILIFGVLRTTGFGLHATKGWICLISTSLLFIGIPLMCKYIELDIYIKIILGIVGTLLIYKNAPADTQKKPIINKKRRNLLKIISSILAVLFTLLSVVIKNNFISNCLICSIVLENILISPLTYKLFKMPYNNYKTFLNEHPNFIK